MYQKVASGTSSETRAILRGEKVCLDTALFAGVGGFSYGMLGKNLYQNYFKGKMTKNEYDLKSDSLPSIGGRGLA